jgi:hypothetical protein
MKYATFKGVKTHAKQAVSGDIGNDIWKKEYEVAACVGKYKQYWKYIDEKPILPPGYEPETEWHAAWKGLVQDEYCEVVCGDNREHRADIKTKDYVIEIQRSPIDGWAVVERNKFYKNLTGTRVIWVANIEKPWKEKRITTELSKAHEDGTFIITWKNEWKWVREISNTKETLLFLDFNSQHDKLILMWTFQKRTYGRWVSKKTFFNRYLLSVAKQEFTVGLDTFMNVFRELLLN